METTITTWLNAEQMHSESQYVFSSLSEAHDFVRLLAPSFFMTELIYTKDGEEIIEVWDKNKRVEGV